MSIIKLILVLGAIILTQGCAINRVRNVYNSFDAKSFYKVPVIYGIGIAKDSLPIKSFEHVGIIFAEYDPVAKKGTAGCLGAADILRVSFREPYAQIPDDNKIHYYVSMVPPGYYASSGIKLYGANPSLYIKVAKTYPQYLGNFWLKKVYNNKYPTGDAFSYISVLPVEYNYKEAKKILKKFNISQEKLQKINFRPTTGRAYSVICTP